MGKPYEKEIANFDKTYKWAKNQPIDQFLTFVKNSAKTPLYVIGSGGSFSATTFISMMHQQIGQMSRCLTPLEFLDYENIGSENSILIVTAGGNNTDILFSFKKALEIEPLNLGIICASTNNKLTKMAEKFSRVFFISSRFTNKKRWFSCYQFINCNFCLDFKSIYRKLFSSDKNSRFCINSA